MGRPGRRPDMDFNFSDDQNSLRDAVAKWVEKGFDFPRRHALAKARIRVVRQRS